MLGKISLISSFIPTLDEIGTFTFTIPDTETLHRTWIITIIIGMVLIGIGLY